jgi:hypothetical protein
MLGQDVRSSQALTCERSNLHECRTVTIEYQRAQAKELVAYFKSKAEEEAIQRSQCALLNVYRRHS